MARFILDNTTIIDRIILSLNLKVHLLDPLRFESFRGRAHICYHNFFSFFNFV